MVTKKKAMVSAAELEKQMLADAEKEYANEKTGGGGLQISIRGSEFTMNGEALGDVMDVVVVASAFEHAYYDSPYNADDPQPPACYALAVDEEELVPYDNSPAVQAESCAECWANEWGSSETGRGKACKNSRRLTLLAVSEEGVEFGEMPTIKVPPASLRNYSGYLKRSTKVTGRPSYGLITRVGFDENSDYETLVFENAGKVEDSETLAQIMSVREAAEESLLEGFDTENYKTPEEIAAQRRARAPKKKKAAAKKKATTKKKVAGRSKMS